MPMGITQAQAGHLAGLTHQRISQLAEENAFAKLKNGRIDGQSFGRWLAERNAKKAAEQSDDRLDLTQERAKKEREQRIKLERENAVAAGELVPAAEISQAMADIYARVGSHVAATMRRVPQALGIPQSQHADARAVLRGLERDLLLAISAQDDEDDDNGKMADTSG